MSTPVRTLLLTRPVDQADVVVDIDGSRAVAADLLGARVFLGDWKAAAATTKGTPHPTFVKADALLVEIASRERDEDGRVEPLALWKSNLVSDDIALHEAKEFARNAGRSFDEDSVRASLVAGLRAQRRLRARGPLRDFFMWLRRLLRSLVASTQKPDPKNGS